MDQKKKSWIIKGGLLAVLLFGLLKFCGSDQAAQSASEQAGRTDAAIVKLLKGPKDEQGKLVESIQISRYNTQGLKDGLNQALARMRVVRQEGDSIDDGIRSTEGTEQPKSVVDAIRCRLARLQELNSSLENIRSQAHEQYAAQIKSWEDSASCTHDLDEVYKRMAFCVEQLKAKRRVVVREMETNRRDGYDVAAETNAGTCMRLDLFLRKWNRQKKELADAQKRENESRNVLVQQGKLNRKAAPIVELEGILRNIDREAVPYATEDSRLPNVAVVATVETPSVFEADLQIVTTGDLSSSLLEPIVKSWIADDKNAGGLGISQEVQTEIGSHGEVNVTVHSPNLKEGHEAGVLRIRLVTVAGDSVFDHLQQGKADLVLTGRVMNLRQEQAWLKSLPGEPRRIERDRCARVASDALVFFRDPKGCLPAAVSDSLLRYTPKVFTTGDKARDEAAAIMGVCASASDIRLSEVLTPTEILKKNRNYLVLGVYHKDKYSLEQCLMGSQVSIDTSNVPKRYRKNLPAGPLQCFPSDATLNSREYVYTYRINFFRQSDSKLGIRLMTYASDLRGRAQKVVHERGFAPLRIDYKTVGRRSILRKNDIPLRDLIGALNQPGLKKLNDFGYDETDEWVYGVKLSYPMHYESGKDDQLADIIIDPESVNSLPETIDVIDDMTKDGSVALVLVGHADLMYNGSLQTSEASFNYNNRLSLARAGSAYDAFFCGAFPPDKYPGLARVKLGCSWTRPVCEIDVSRSLEDLQHQLALCRRVEVFLIFPKLTEEEQKAKID